MPGQARLGPRVEPATLARAFPQQSETQLAFGARIIGSIPLAGLGWSEAQQLGMPAQQRYGDSVQALLDIAGLDVLRRAPVQLSRLQQILELCAQDFEAPSGIVSQWFKKDKPRQTELHKPELDQLREKLKLRMQELQDPIARLIEVRGQFHALFDELVAHSIAAEWLSGRDEADELVRNALVERSQALLKTAALVKVQQAQSLATARQLDSLRDRIQDAVLIALPSWLAHLSGLPTTINDTQRFVLRDDLQQILDRLKG